ncbi:MAG: prephenate dehydrogenase/arogenate dehydrogenase family protein [Candidatus Moranbacteria bacterium]|nr:prephenate dehydrogenase/arogenate dehydrogenase family protein [Candidatus Moranbacteria bacterium]
MIMNKEKKNQVGIFGFGDFGRLLACILNKNFEVKLFDYKLSPADKKLTKKLKLKIAGWPEIFQSRVIVLAVPISQTQALIKKISSQLKPGTLLLDVCSVKVLPCKWLKKYTDKDIQIMGTHPMFGPASANFNLDKLSYRLKDLQIVLCPLRIKKNRYEKIKKYLTDLELEVIKATPSEHDHQAAKCLGFMHYLARILWTAEFKEQQLTTKGYEHLKATYYTIKDSWQLLYDMNNYNPYVDQIKQKFNRAQKRIDKRILQAKNESRLDYYRQSINAIDQKLLELLEERFKITTRVGAYKKKRNLPILDSTREKQLTDRALKQSKLDPRFIRDFYRLILNKSYETQGQTKNK